MRNRPEKRKPSGCGTGCPCRKHKDFQWFSHVSGRPPRRAWRTQKIQCSKRLGSVNRHSHIIRVAVFCPDLPAVISEDHENSGNSRTVIVSPANNINLTKTKGNELSPLGALCVTICVIGQREGKTRLGGKPYKTNGNQGSCRRVLCTFRTK